MCYQNPMRDLNDHLREEFILRKNKNPNYSLRAFSRDLNISVTSLSQCLNGLRVLSKTNEKKVAAKLGLKYFFDRDNLQERLSLSEETLINDELKSLSEWYYIAIMNLAKLENCKNCVSWISERLNISKLETQVALSRLSRLGYIKVQKNNLIRTKNIFKTSFDIPSETIKTLHLQNLQNSQKALNEYSVEEREFINVIADVNSGNLKEAKILTRQYMQELTKLMQKGKANNVFSLSVQIFPLTKK